MKSIQSNIKKAKKYLDKNHCIAVPTETVYGLAGNAYSDVAVKKIFKLKKRPVNNPLIVHYYDINKLKHDCYINDNFIKLCNKFSPGPITFILKLKKDVGYLEKQAKKSLEEFALKEAQEEDDFDEEFFDEEWDEIHTARQKPVLDDETKENLLIRAAQMKKQPKFRRQEWYRYKRLSRSGWRKPKGYQSKQRLNMKYRTPMARVGYGKVRAAKDLHPSGFIEVLVHNSSSLNEIDPKTHAIRIGKRVGNRKRLAIHIKADVLGI
mgnify:CR=1 FL=1